LDNGDGHIIRNAGGIITDDVIRSLCLSQRALGTREIILLHHTKCGVCGVIEEEFRAELEAEYGVVPEWSSGGFSDPYDDVRRSIELLRASPFVPHTDHVRGFVYDVDTGLIDPVD
ncbi:MAG: carbonic anhydrase, partial [Acidimicrobiaceae bacterium]